MVKNVLIAALAFLVIIFYVDSCRKVHRETPAEITKHEVKEAADSAGVKPQAVKEVIKYQTVTRTQIKTVVDTFNRIEYKDKWTEVKGEIKHDTVNLDITITDSIQVVQYEKRKNWFSKKKTYIDVFNSNPNVQVNNIRHYEVKQQPKRWSVGIGITYGWNGTQWQPSVGVSLTRKLFNF
jgi:hypothetical protein